MDGYSERVYPAILACRERVYPAISQHKAAHYSKSTVEDPLSLHLQLGPCGIRPVDVVELSARLVGALIGMGAKVVPLSLQKILR